MSARQLAVVSAGLVTCVGLNTATTCAALRCRLNNFIETGFTDLEDEAVIGAPVPWPEGGIRLEKLAEMAASAIRQALASANLALEQLPHIPLMLCIAETERAGRIPDLDNVKAIMFAATMTLPPIITGKPDAYTSYSLGSG